MSRELILCALHRLGKPSMAADVADRAAALALEHGGWPRATPASISPASAAAFLSKSAEKIGTVKDPSGNNRPLFQPVGGEFRPDWPMPDPPKPMREERPLSQAQAQTLIGCLEEIVMTQRARIVEQDQQIERMHDELRRSVEGGRRYNDASRDLLARIRDRLQRVGLAEEA